MWSADGPPSLAKGPHRRRARPARPWACPFPHPPGRLTTSGRRPATIRAVLTNSAIDRAEPSVAPTTSAEWSPYAYRLRRLSGQAIRPGHNRLADSRHSRLDPSIGAPAETFVALNFGGPGRRAVLVPPAASASPSIASGTSFSPATRRRSTKQPPATYARSYAPSPARCIPLCPNFLANLARRTKATTSNAMETKLDDSVPRHLGRERPSAPTWRSSPMAANAGDETVSGVVRPTPGPLAGWRNARAERSAAGWVLPRSAPESGGGGNAGAKVAASRAYRNLAIYWKSDFPNCFHLIQSPPPPIPYSHIETIVAGLYMAILKPQDD